MEENDFGGVFKIWILKALVKTCRIGLQSSFWFFTKRKEEK
jgi:hypothetical protein